MGHYAKVVESKVVQVIVAEEEFFETFIDSSPGRWIQTSYNTRGNVHYDKDGNPDGGVALRKNYAGVGYTYDELLDAFIPQKPYDSWILNEDTCLWECPVAHPDDPRPYFWDEANQIWVLAYDGEKA